MQAVSFQKLEIPLDAVTASKEGLKGAVNKSIYQLFKDRDISNKDYTESFASTTNQIDVPNMRNFFGVYLASYLNGKTSAEINEILGTKDDLLQIEKDRMQRLMADITF